MVAQHGAEAVAPQVIGHTHCPEVEQEELEEEELGLEENSRVKQPEEHELVRLDSEKKRGGAEEPDKSPQDVEEAAMLIAAADGATPNERPHPQKPESRKITMRDAATNLVTCMIGASVLSLPHVVAKTGWVLGPLCLASAGFVSCRGCLLVNQAIDVTTTMQGTRPRNIGDVAEVCFGKRGRTIVVGFTCFFQVAKCGVYLLVIGTNLHFWQSAVTERQCTLFATLICLRLVFLQDIKVISRWSVIGVVASVFYLLTISAGGVQAAFLLPPEDRPWGLWPLRLSELPAMFAVMLYAYSPADVLPVMKSDMEKPEELPTAICLAHGAVAMIYVGLSAAGYFGWGRRVEGNVLKSMCDHPGCPGTIPEPLPPGTKWSVGYVLSIAVVSNLMVTIPVVLYCVFQVLESQCQRLRSSRSTNSCMRVTIVLGAVSIAVFVPFFVEVLAVISTALLVSLQIFVPVAVTFALKTKGAAVRCGVPEVCLLGLGLCVFSVGMAGALRNLSEAIARGAS